MTRICITGGPRTGKTSLATRMSSEAGLLPSDPPQVALPMRSTDYLIGKLDWSEASTHVARYWLDAPGPWIIEGVAVSRALRKWHDSHPGEPPPVDRVIHLRDPHEPLSKGQLTMAKGVETVHAEIESWLRKHGVVTEYMIGVQLNCEHPGHDGTASIR